VARISSPREPESESRSLRLTPTAKHDVADGQVRSSKSARSEGRGLAAHVVPPSVVTSTTGPLDEIPPAKQSVAVGQLMLSKTPVPEGRVPGVQVVPPSVVLSTTPVPR
jgi:hypothetical protein